MAHYVSCSVEYCLIAGVFPTAQNGSMLVAILNKYFGLALMAGRSPLLC
jgi:hypothetical protein